MGRVQKNPYSQNRDTKIGSKISFDSSNKKQKKSLKEKKQKKDVVPTSWTSSNITTLLSIVRDHIVSGNVHTDSGFKNADWYECFSLVFFLIIVSFS